MSLVNLEISTYKPIGESLCISNDFNSTLLKTSQKKTFREGIYLLFFAIGNILGGLVSFQIKYLKILFPDDYDGFYLNLWRSIFIASIVRLYIKYKRLALIDPFRIENKFWFQARTTGQFITFITFVYSLKYIRVGTSTLIFAMNPILVVIFACFILNEKFHLRYLIGIATCFLGCFIIVMNDNRSKPSNIIPDNNDQQTHTYNTIIGVVWGFIGLFFSAMLVISSKVLMKEKINIENQIYYIFLINGLLSVIAILCLSEYRFNMGFVLGSIINGLTLLASTVFTIEGIKGVDVNKTTPLSFCGTLFVFLISVVLIGEYMCLSDFFGCGIIIAYNVVNSLYPIKR
jgi:drug/metabolite transporter (DMT)-like permease